MIYKRLDGGCEARILSFNPKEKYGLLIEATWPSGGRYPNRNIVNISPEYFVEKYVDLNNL